MANFQLDAGNPCGALLIPSPLQKRKVLSIWFTCWQHQSDSSSSLPLPLHLQPSGVGDNVARVVLVGVAAPLLLPLPPPPLPLTKPLLCSRNSSPTVMDTWTAPLPSSTSAAQQIRFCVCIKQKRIKALLIIQEDRKENEVKTNQNDNFNQICAGFVSWLRNVL